MSSATELIARQMAAGSANARVWADILYNVKLYGAKGDWNGTTGTDDTVSVQATIDAAIAAGGKAVFFPHGTYKVTTLTNLSSVVLFGDNASFVGISTTINQIGSPTSNLAINVKEYGAKGDGVTDDSAAIKSAITAAAVTGGTVWFPPGGTYKLNVPIDVAASNIQIVGKGATIDCRGTSGLAGINEIGGGIVINGDNVTVSGLKFVGYAVTQGLTTYGYGRLLVLNGNQNEVTKCNFKDGNGGAVVITGNKNSVNNSYFDTCNNQASVGADYGAIQLYGGYGNIISDNWLENQYYAGVCMIGDISKTKILNNYIKGSSPLGQNTSSGVYIFNGASRDLEISGNTCENFTAEAIGIFSNSANPANAITISDNILRDYGQSGVAIYNGDSAVSTNVKIEGNVFESVTVDPALHIFTSMMKHSSICDNVIKGKQNVLGTIAYGISIGDSPANNTVTGNTISNVNIGISFSDTLGGVCSENTIVLCTRAIDYAFCQRSRICDNNIVDCTTGFTKGSSADFAFLSGNMVSGHTTASNAPLLYGDVQTTTGATAPYATGTLVAGTATITFYNIDDGDVFIVVPFTYAVQANCGSLYIAEQNSSSDTMIIKSTNAADVRKFMVLKVARGVT